MANLRASVAHIIRRSTTLYDHVIELFVSAEMSTEVAVRGDIRQLRSFLLLLEQDLPNCQHFGLRTQIFALHCAWLLIVTARKVSVVAVYGLPLFRSNPIERFLRVLLRDLGQLNLFDKQVFS